MDELKEDYRVCVYMFHGPSWHIGDNISFTREHPYQLMTGFDAYNLINTAPDRFRVADPEDVKRHYGLEKR